MADLLVSELWNSLLVSHIYHFLVSSFKSLARNEKMRIFIHKLTLKSPETYPTKVLKSTSSIPPPCFALSERISSKQFAFIQHYSMNFSCATYSRFPLIVVLEKTIINSLFKTVSFGPSTSFGSFYS